MTTSSDLFARAQNILVGGVDSPVRAFRAVGGSLSSSPVLEILTGIQRAGAPIVLTYHAKDAARWLKHC